MKGLSKAEKACHAFCIRTSTALSSNINWPNININIIISFIPFFYLHFTEQELYKNSEDKNFFISTPNFCNSKLLLPLIKVSIAFILVVKKFQFYIYSVKSCLNRLIYTLLLFSFFPFYIDRLIIKVTTFVHSVIDHSFLDIIFI